MGLREAEQQVGARLMQLGRPDRHPDKEEVRGSSPRTPTRRQEGPWKQGPFRFPVLVSPCCHGDGPTLSHQPPGSSEEGVVYL